MAWRKETRSLMLLLSLNCIYWELAETVEAWDISVFVDDVLEQVFFVFYVEGVCNVQFYSLSILTLKPPSDHLCPDQDHHFSSESSLRSQSSPRVPRLRIVELHTETKNIWLIQKYFSSFLIGDVSVSSSLGDEGLAWTRVWSMNRTDAHHCPADSVFMLTSAQSRDIIWKEPPEV